MRISAISLHVSAEGEICHPAGEWFSVMGLQRQNLTRDEVSTNCHPIGWQVCGKARITLSQSMIDVSSPAPLATSICKWKCKDGVGGKLVWVGEIVLEERWAETKWVFPKCDTHHPGINSELVRYNTR